jgi:hypothetical protein
MKRLRRIAIFPLVCLVMSSGLGIGPSWSVVGRPGSGLRQPAEACGSWEQPFSPNPLEEDLLHGVAVLSPTEAWAVGQAFTESRLSSALIARWNGNEWMQVATRLPANAVLEDVSAAASNDVWAVGWVSVTTSPFAAHWDGHAWSSVPVPNPGGETAQLLGVVAIASDDAWAVGWRSAKTMVQHWDGSAWTIVHSFNTKGVQVLNDVSASSPTDVWAVGWRGFDQRTYGLIQHWDGSRWSRVMSGGLRTNLQLTDVAAVSDSDAWAVGFTDEEGTDRTAVERWDGSTWHGADAPRVRGKLSGVAAGAPDDVWMAGFAEPENTLTEHWDGTSVEVFPSNGPGDNHLEAVDVLPSGEAWAAGWYYSDNGKRYTLTLHFVPC